MHALRLLRRGWIWAVLALLPAAYLALSTAYSVGPSGIHRKTLEYGAAQTQMLVDSKQSTLVQANGNVANLASVAEVFAEFFQTTPVINQMSRSIGVPASKIAVNVVNTNVNLPVTATEPNAGQRNTGLLQESRALQLQAQAQPGLPLITVNTQGPTGRAAARLANAAATALSDYVRSLKSPPITRTEIRQQIQSGLVPPSRVGVRQLGRASGAMVDSGASTKIAALAFVGLVLLDVFLVIMIAGAIERTRERRAVEASLGTGAAEGSLAMASGQTRSQQLAAQQMPSGSGMNEHAAVPSGQASLSQTVEQQPASWSSEVSGQPLNGAPHTVQPEATNPPPGISDGSGSRLERESPPVQAATAQAPHLHQTGPPVQTNGQELGRS